MGCPRGGARGSLPTPIEPPAPPTFSTITGWPSAAPILSAMMRAATSVEPPGGNGTISVIGRDGKLSACAGASATGRSASAIQATLRIRATIRLCIFAPRSYVRQVFVSDTVPRFCAFYPLTLEGLLIPLAPLSGGEGRRSARQRDDPGWGSSKSPPTPNSSPPRGARVGGRGKRSRSRGAAAREV